MCHNDEENDSILWGGGVKYDIVHMRDQAFSKQPLNEFGLFTKKKTPKQVLTRF